MDVSKKFAGVTTILMMFAGCSSTSTVATDVPQASSDADSTVTSTVPIVALEDDEPPTEARPIPVTSTTTVPTTATPATTAEPESATGSDAPTTTAPAPTADGSTSSTVLVPPNNVITEVAYFPSRTLVWVHDHHDEECGHGELGLANDLGEVVHLSLIHI